LCRDLSTNTADVITSAVQSLPATGKYPHRTAILLLDPLAGVGEEAVLAAGAAFGPDVLVAGGAAGDDVAMKETFVSLGPEAASNAAVVAQLFTEKPLGIGVHHGHQAISKAVEVTRAAGNVVYELDGRPAWDVWADATREHARTRGVDPDALSESEVGSYLLRYEGGLATGGAIKVRAPLSRGADGSLSFACGIAEGAKIVITESTPDRQVESARIAARSARERLGGGPVAGAIVFDCICRNLILGDRFEEAVRGMSEELGGAPLAGFETYGEIALEGGAMSGFHNTTTVVLAFPR
jgi:methyl-accepting chemotaxis protein